jgi:hypothetical protein
MRTRHWRTSADTDTRLSISASPLSDHTKRNLRPAKERLSVSTNFSLGTEGRIAAYHTSPLGMLFHDLDFISILPARRSTGERVEESVSRDMLVWWLWQFFSSHLLRCNFLMHFGCFFRLLQSRENRHLGCKSRNLEWNEPVTQISLVAGEGNWKAPPSCQQ